VSPRGHSAKRTLSSAGSGALDKVYFKIKKNLCRVLDHGHSAKTVYLPTVSPFFLTLSLSLSSRRRPSSSARAPLDRTHPSPSARAAAALDAPPARAPRPAALDAPHPAALTAPPPLAVPLPLAAPLAAPAPPAAPRPSRLVFSSATPAPRRLALDPPSRPRPILEGDLYEMIRFNIKSYLYTCFG
jgi:hypothetical protein